MTRVNFASLYIFRAGVKFAKCIPSQNPRQCLPDVNNSSRQGFRKPTACSQKCWSKAQLGPAPALAFGCLDMFGFALSVTFFQRGVCLQDVFRQCSLCLGPNLHLGP